ncbi:receptor-type tyrosine-protein phosphatase eta-like [Labeo rohita]|uniref:receptor-type tyrosine-protein phosphatase eta-like n=1 Tax=Labeo rohita TaxID=84645 RepID=UPI0021E2623D|nr:receptor-type tyrosine-protein phosphatase eta-like [Labeo rohita]
MGCLSIKTVCKGTALLIIVILRGLNAQNTTATESDLSNGTQATALNTTSSPSTKSQTPAPTAPATTSPTSTQTAVTKPDVIRNLTVNEITTSSVFLTWAEPIGKRSFFKIQWTDNRTNENSATNTSYNITGLTAGVNYTFCITAVAADDSTEGGTVCVSQYTKPDVIRNLTVNNITTSSVFLTWNEPAGNRSFFKLQWTGDQTSGNLTTTNTSYNITGLTAGVSYTFCITAVAENNSTGETVCISQYTKPNVLKNLRVFEITTSSVFLTWDEPAGNRSFFKVRWTDEKTSGNSTTTNTSYNITGLTAGVNYTFIITAVAADDSTGETVCISQYTRPDVIINLKADDITASSVLLNWTKPNGQSSHYRVEYEDKNVIIVNTSIIINDLIPGTQNTFKVFAVAADHVTEGRSSQISLYTKPDVIRNLTVSEITTSSVFLTWDEPRGMRSFFNVQCTQNSNTTNTSYNITGLTAGVSYTFCITAVAADSSTEGETVCISQYTKPDVIRNLTVTEITTSSMTLKWNEPAGNRDFFRIHWSEKRMYVITKDTSYSITGLSAEVSYSVCITAVTADKSTEGQTVCISQYTKSSDTLYIWLIVGVVLGVICFLFIIILIFFICSKRQTNEQYPDIPLHIFSNTAMSIDDYEEYFKKKFVDGFAEEYEKLKSDGMAQSKNIALATENKAKNRDSNVLPYDASRVKLSICGSPFDDYINASYVPGYKSREEFVAAQCPLPNTKDEFWRMIWEKNIYTIVMLTKCNEQVLECDKYWPSGTNNYNNISVTTTSEKEMESWTIRDFGIKNVKQHFLHLVKTEEARNICQFHFTAWPDNGFPQTTEVLINFRCLVRKHMDQYSRHSPAVVHCSSGIATGVFIAIDHLIFQIERDSMVDVCGIVTDMEMHRPLVMTEEQYSYLHQCAYDIIRSRTGTNMDLIYQNTASPQIYENTTHLKQ